MRTGFVPIEVGKPENWREYSTAHMKPNHRNTKKGCHNGGLLEKSYFPTDKLVLTLKM